ncbi:MAG TPA: hydrogenase maturation protease [Thermodesulfovibrionales bacterium]|nr:hydrogenase maturation protease [Thermodesulfovibrionales bacterium]
MLRSTANAGAVTPDFSADCIAPITVAGAGNRLLSVDNIGPRMLELVQGRYGPEVEICNTGTGGLNLLDHLHRQDLLIVIDACISGREPGEVFVIEPELDEAEVRRDCSVHQIGPLETLITGHHLYPDRMPKRILLVLVETEGIDEEGKEAAGRKVIDILDREIRLWCGLIRD